MSKAKPTRRRVSKSKASTGAATGASSGSGAGARSSGRSRAIWLLVVLGLVVVPLAYAGLWLLTANPGRHQQRRVVLAPNATSAQIAYQLYRSGLVQRPWLMSWALTLTGVTDRIARRTLLLRDDDTPRGLLRALVNGGGLWRVTLREGVTSSEIADKLAHEGVLRDRESFETACKDEALLHRLSITASGCEGYLFPDTYDFYLESTPETVIERMVRNFRRRWTDAQARARETDARVSDAHLDELGILTLASMIEREAGTPADRPKVSSVFYNRLTRPEFSPRLLQSDPTVLYGCHVATLSTCNKDTRTLVRSMLDDERNPYNTYKHIGLPPGPICNPGRAAIEAAMAPAQTAALYFVAMGEGRSAFANTLAEHNANVQRFLRRREE